MTEQRNCLKCGVAFVPKQRSVRYCSKACTSKIAAEAARVRHAAIRAGEQQKSEAELRYEAVTHHPTRYGSLVIKSVCKECGNTFEGRSYSACWCSDGCRSLYETHKLRINLGLNCRYCGVLFCRVPGSRLSTCSDECQEGLHTWYSAARRGNNGTNLVKRGVHVSCHWTCQACGCSTPELLQGTHDDNAPEVDHIVARAKGGPDTYDNAHTLCRLCNGLKSDTEWYEFLTEWFPSRLPTARSNRRGHAHSIYT